MPSSQTAMAAIVNFSGTPLMALAMNKASRCSSGSIYL
jgi:hypothetical protein